MVLGLMGVVSSGLLMISGACLVLAIIHLRFWIAEPKRKDYLAFAVVCLSVTVFSWFELALCHSRTTEEYNFYTQWSHIAAAPAIISAGWFAYLNLGGRRWLFLLVCGARLAALFLNFL